MAIVKRSSGGEEIQLVGRQRLKQKEVRKTVIREMWILRCKGFTDSEIAMKYRYVRETVNRMINSLPAHDKERLRRHLV